MKRKVLKKVFVCRECESRELDIEGYVQCMMALRYHDDGTPFLDICDSDPSRRIGSTAYACRDCGEPPCLDDSEVKDDNELIKYLELYGVEQEFEIETPEDEKIEA